MNKLKRCPLCGGRATFDLSQSIGYIDAQGNKRYTDSLKIVRCMECGCMTYPYETFDAATEAWNRRVENDG